MRRYLVAAGLLRLALDGARVALVLLAVDRLGTAAIGGALIAALLVPGVVAAPVVGVVVDRSARPRLVLAAAGLVFAAALAVAAAGVGAVPLPLVFAGLLAGGCCSTAVTGALSSRVPDLVTDRALPRAFGADSVTYNVAGIGGPLLTTLLAGVVGPGGATAVLAATAAVGAGVVATLPLSPPAADRGPAPPLTAAAVTIARHRTLGTVTLAGAAEQLGNGALPVVAVVLTTQAGRPDATGWLLSAVALGALAGSLLWTWRPARADRAPRAMMVALVAVGVPYALAAAAPSLVVTGALFALAGVAVGPLVGAMFTARQLHTPPPLRAQVFTIGAGLRTTAAAGGAAVAGLLVGLPVPVLLLLVAAGPIVGGLAGALSLATAPRPTEQPAR